MQKALDAAVENENYEILQYLLTDADLGGELIIEEARISLNAAMSCPESSSFARLMIKHNAELPRNLYRHDMNPFAQDFHDRYLRSHIFGPKIKWWSSDEVSFIIFVEVLLTTTGHICARLKSTEVRRNRHR